MSGSETTENAFRPPKIRKLKTVTGQLGGFGRNDHSRRFGANCYWADGFDLKIGTPDYDELLKVDIANHGKVPGLFRHVGHNTLEMAEGSHEAIAVFMAAAHRRELRRWTE